MKSVAAVSLLVASCVAIGCAAGSPDSVASSAEWVGAITTEGGVTTVRNESGSLWGGAARLVEEASIGVDAGDDAYMLGRVRSIAASDERIYVIDSQVPALRTYDWNGVHVRDLGREGEGPGEFRSPSSVGVDAQGRVWLHDQIMQRIVVFTPDGEPLTTLSLGGARISGSRDSMVLAPQGIAYVLDIVRPEEPAASGDELRIVWRPHDMEGVAGDPIDIPRDENPAYLEARSSNAVRVQAIPFQPNGDATFAASGVLVTGHPSAYAFEVRHPDGRVMRIERSWTPVPVLPGEADAHRQAAIDYLRELDPDWTWGDAEIPATKPAFSRLLPALSGETWVVRPGPARHDESCDEASFPDDGEAHCWTEEPLVDVFGPDGRYLGAVTVPAGLQWDPRPHINGSDFIARVEDDAGTVMVKRYRLALPEGASPAGRTPIP